MGRLQMGTIINNNNNLYCHVNNNININNINNISSFKQQFPRIIPRIT